MTPDTLSCGCPSAGKPCPHVAVPGKKRGGATQLRAERDALRAALAAVLASHVVTHSRDLDTTVEGLMLDTAPEVLAVALVALGREP